MGETSTARHILIRDLDWIVTCNDSNAVDSDVAIVVSDDRILDIGHTDSVLRRHADRRFDRVIDGRRRLAAPGFVNTHLHTDETFMRGLAPDDLTTRDWVFNWALPFRLNATPADNRLQFQLACIEMLKTGTTCFIDHGSFTDPSVLADVIRESGIRGIVSLDVSDIPPGSLPQLGALGSRAYFSSTDESLAAMRAAIERYHGSAGDRIRAWSTIVGSLNATDRLFAGAVELARAHGVGCCYHLATNREEVELALERWGERPIMHAARINALSPQTLLIHAVAVSDGAELETLAASGAKVSLNPGCSLRLAKGATAQGRYPEMLRHGVTVALGCDAAATSGNLDMLRQVYLAAGMFKDARMDPAIVSARQAIRMGTIDGARALLWDDHIGSLEVGKKADIVLFDLRRTEWTPIFDPEHSLAYSASGSSVDVVLVDGDVVVEGGSVTHLDESGVIDEARERALSLARQSHLLARRAAHDGCVR